MQIGQYQLPNNLFVAPMAGVTDRPFRTLCKKLGAGYAVSEMVTSRRDLWHKVSDKYKHSSVHVKALDWLERIGPKACLLSFLPVVGDPLCAVAGWLKLPFWPCVAYMVIGKFLRYLVMTALLLGLFPAKFAGVGF